MLKHHLISALRQARRQPAHSAVSIVGLALGLASFLFLAVYIADEFSYDRVYENAHRVARVVTDVVNNDEAVSQSAYSFAALGPAMLREIPHVESMTRVGHSYASAFVRVDENRFSRERILMADSSFFDLFDHRFLQGEPETALNRPYAVVLTASTARRYFGEADPIGRTIDIENQAEYEVTAVVEDPPSNTHLKFDALYSFETYNAMFPGRFDNGWRILYGYTYVLLAPGASRTTIESHLLALTAPHLQSTSERWGASFRFALQPLADIHLYSHLGDEIEPVGSIVRLRLLFGIAVLVFLVACVNFVSLSVARAGERRRELGMRKTLGASSVQLLRQHLIESSLVVFVALMLAFALFQWLFPAFNQLAGKSIRFDFMDHFLVSCGLIFLAGLVVLSGGIVPAMTMSSFRSREMWGGISSAKGSGGGLWRAMVVFEFGAAAVLMIGAVAVYLQIDLMKRAELGFDRDHVIVLGERFAGSPVPRWEEMKTIKNELLRGPAISAVTLASEWPTRPVQGLISISSDDGQRGSGLQMAWYQVEEHFLKTLGMELTQGRNFSSELTSDSNAIMINQEAARRLGIVESQVVGRSLYDPEDGRELGTIIGVVNDFHTRSLQEPLEPVVIVTEWARPRNILVRIDGRDVPGALAYIEETWARMMPEKPLVYDFLDQQYAAMYRSEERLSRLAGVFTGLALFVACMGLWSLAAFSAHRKMREIGVRKVLGASVRQIVALLVNEFLKLIVVAFAVAAPVAWFVMQRWLDGYAYRIDLSIWIVVAIGVVILGTAALTVSYQSIRAAVADPVESIRSEL